jgi:hypothetical protein
MRRRRKSCGYGLSWGSGSARSHDVVGWARSMSILSGRQRRGSAGHCRKDSAKRTWKPSCLATSRFGRRWRSRGHNRTGERFMSNCNGIAI